MIWIVYTQGYPPDRSPPTFLAAYDGEEAEQSAAALVELVRKAEPGGEVLMTGVPLWPTLKSDGEHHPSPHSSR